jgi:hypothetical protein
MIIGGIASSYYGNPMQTFDIDIKIDLDERRLNAFIEGLSSIGKAAIKDPFAFLQETSVLPFDIDQVRIDLIRCHLPFEIAAIRRAERRRLFGLEAVVCSAEDLIIQKALSIRDKDWLDIAAIIGLQKTALDWDYLLQHLEDLSSFLADPEILKRVEKLKNEK